MKLDSLDERLIKLLQDDAHQSSEALAKELGLSSSTVRRRINRLLQSDVIRIVARTDPEKVGLQLYAVLAFDVAHNRMASAVQELSACPAIKWLSTTTGRFDIVAVAAFRTTNDLSNFLHTAVPKIKGLRDSETFICLEVEKGSYMQI